MVKVIELWVVIDADGDYECAQDEGDAVTRYTESVGDIDGTRGIRRVKVTLSVPLPVDIAVAATVAAEEVAGVVGAG